MELGRALAFRLCAPRHRIVDRRGQEDGNARENSPGYIIVGRRNHRDHAKSQCATRSELFGSRARRRRIVAVGSGISVAVGSSVLVGDADGVLGSTGVINVGVAVQHSGFR